MLPDHTAVLAAAEGIVVAGGVVALLAMYGAWHACRAIADWAAWHRDRRAWERSTRLTPAPPAPPEAPAFGDEPLVHGGQPHIERHPGTNTDALTELEHIWKHSPTRREEDQ